ncbi:hypothetical protein [Burkholderia ambifaria]|uniref:hypothetical protein n=1 Tax=Burkholderia ambifaria TaxID=152480 RepID=UPI001FC81814|nr:hypothetical protein [Burkholderia ambifaria]
MDKRTAGTLPANFLFDDLLERIHQGSVKWHLVLVQANPADRTDNATIAWSGPHRRIDASTQARSCSMQSRRKRTDIAGTSITIR